MTLISSSCQAGGIWLNNRSQALHDGCSKQMSLVGASGAHRSCQSTLSLVLMVVMDAEQQTPPSGARQVSHLPH